MSGKTSTSTSGVTIPPAVLSQYESVIGTANQTAQTPFQTYSGTGTPVAPGYDSGNTGSFVAPLSTEQESGIANTNTAADSYQPYYAAATGTLGTTQANTTGVNNAATGLAAGSSTLSGADVNNFLSPYLGDVLGSTEALQNVSNQQAQAGQLGNAISSGAFGGDRTGIAAANLQGQLNLSNANTISNIANQGFNTALGAAQTEQGIGLQGAQTLAGIGQTAYGEGANTASELAALGTGAQSAGLAGANAQIQAGTVEQQTQQAEDTAQYNQFLQQQSYPFQVGQWLSGISTGLGTNEGSTTTTTQPGGFFSDKRLKHSIQKIGKTYDGQTIYSYKMGDDPRTRIGLIAQEVEKKHPDAVGLAAGFKMVDYGKATQPAANRGHFYSGGVVPFRRVARAYGGGNDLDAVLQAQQQMYSGLGGAQTQRQMPTQASSSHGIAVTNAPAAAPQSGISNVNQTIGLGQKGYQLYNKFNAPSTSSGVSPSVTPDTGLQESYLNAGTSADGGLSTPMSDAELQEGYLGAGSSSGVAPSAAVSAAPAASDAAASGATDAAAGAATDAAAGAAGDAAAGAATGAAAGAGADAAAEAAAALAAEYAAADVATAAVIAARRGGRIKRAVGGGMPYSDDYGAYDIPDDASTGSNLKAAPAAGKQPTGLQTMMYMGDPNNTSSLMGSMFSNEALARGGVAGRKHYGDGGDVAPEPDSDDMPDGGLADAAASTPSSSSTGVGAAKDPDAPSWFEKHKGTILPILQGLAAMGTAKTVHPGVALAAGLGAGASSYLDTQSVDARNAELNARAQGQQIQNQVSTLGLNAAKSALSNNSGLPTAPVRPPGMVSGDPNDPQELAFSKFAPLPTARPDAVNQQVTGMTFVGKPDAGNSIGSQYDQRVALANQNRTLGANAAYLNALGVVNAPAGQAFAAMAKQNPTKAAQMQQSGADPATLDQQARAWASQMGFAAHQWSNRPASMQNGVLIDQQTNAPVIGSDQIMTGLTPAEKQSAYDAAMAPVVLGNGLPGRTYQQAGFSTPEQYIIAQDKASRLSAVNGNSSAQTAPQSQSAAAPAATAAPAAAAPRRTAPTGAALLAASPVSTGDAYQDKALADPRYRQPALPPIVDQITKQAAEGQQKVNIEKKAQLSDDASHAIPAAATALQFMTAAKQILQAKGAPVVGLYGPVANQVSRAFGGVDATNYQKVVKYLGNAAVQAGKDNFPNATQSEVGLQLGELSPNPGQTDDAILDLLNTNIRSAKYTIDSAHRVQNYLDAGNNPQRFPDWNNQYYRRDVVVNAARSAVGANGQRIYDLGGRWVDGGGHPIQAQP